MDHLMSVNTLRYLFRALFTTSCSKRSHSETVYTLLYHSMFRFCFSAPDVMCEIFLVVGIYDIDCVIVLHELNVVHRTHQTEVIRRNIIVFQLFAAGKNEKKKRTEKYVSGWMKNSQCRL